MISLYSLLALLGAAFASAAFGSSAVVQAQTTAPAARARIVELSDYMSPDEPDHCAALQRAHDANPGGLILMPTGVVRLGREDAPCEIDWRNAVRLEGRGWSERGDEGTVLVIAPQPRGWNGRGTFYVHGPQAAGSTFRGFAVRQSQPTPAANWAPAVYAPVFQVEDVNGQVTIDDLFPAPVYDFVRARYAGRLHVTRIRGHVLHRFVDADMQYDIDRYSAHLWPYWSQHPAIQSWTQREMIAFDFGRVDTPSVDLFCFACYAGVRTYRSPGGGTPTRPGGAMTKLDGKVRVDAAAYGLLIESDNLQLGLEYLLAQNEAVPQGKAMAVPGGRAIRLTGKNAHGATSLLHGELSDAGAIEFAGEASGNSLHVGVGYFQRINQSGAQDAQIVVNNGKPNTVVFGQKPYVDLSPGSSCGGACTYGLGVSSVRGQANEPRAFAGAAGKGVIYGAIGDDANVNVVIQPKGGGSAILAGGAPVLAGLPQGCLVVSGGGLPARCAVAGKDYVAPGRGGGNAVPQAPSCAVWSAGDLACSIVSAGTTGGVATLKTGDDAGSSGILTIVLARSDKNPKTCVATLDDSATAWDVQATAPRVLDRQDGTISVAFNNGRALIKGSPYRIAYLCVNP